MRLRVVVLAAMIASASPARADPAAEQLFRDGKALMAKGKLAEACDLFARSQKLEPRSGTLLNLAVCLEELGRTASAWDAFLETKALATTEGNGPRSAEANRRAAALKKKLAYVTVNVSTDHVVEGFELRRDGTVLDPAVWNVAVPIDPGDHTFVASAPGYESWSRDQKITPGQRATLVVEPLLKIATVAPPAATTTAMPTTTTPTAPAQEPASLVAHAVTAVPPPRRLAIGASVGESTDVDPLFSIRVVGNIALAKGAVRGVGSALYNKFHDDPTNGFMQTDQVLIGGGAEYVWLTQQLAFSIGASAGLDLLFRNSNRGTDAAPWWGLRASPLILRLLDSRLEAGIHLQVIQSTDRWAGFGLVGLDWYVR